MTLEDKIRSMVMVHIPGLDAGRIASETAALGVGGVILMGNNIPSPVDSLAAATQLIKGEAGLPLLVATDQEGGIVRRIQTDQSPGADELRTMPVESSREAFAARAQLLNSLGVSINFGIVADVTSDPQSFIFERTLGSTAADAAPRVAAAVTGERGIVLSTVKHFPGHGISPGDSHVSIPSSAIGIDEWRVVHAPPFASAIEAGAELVMMGHLQLDAVDSQPASLSSAWISILRDELGFDGIVITDDMLMLERSGRAELVDTVQNSVRAIAAGNSMLLYVGPVDVAAIVDAIAARVRAGDIPESMIDEAAELLLETRRLLSGKTGPFAHCFAECRDRLN
ncbi:MAG: glycoside hydrolase family 3 protein [Salinibacterium sp.]|nr:glycoside hydrolase family 3 protein [Salinibacterium sp.]